MNTIKIGNLIRRLRKEKQMTQAQLAEQTTENTFYIISEHEMTKEHYITFVALVTSDSLVLKKQYPEWDLQVRIPIFAHGRLLWYCNQHGLFYQEV